MASDDGAQHAPSTRNVPFVLRTLLDDVPLSADGEPGVRINCVEFYDGNLYVGTSESELLHFVQIPPDPADPSSRPSFILASRLQPPYAALPENAPKPGIQQLVLLPKIGKAVILCNYTVTFYLLPELSPTFKDMQVKNACGIGGVDLDDDSDDAGGGGDTLLLSLSRKLRVVKLRGEEPRVLRTIDFAGNINSVRRGTIACVADLRNYALLDIERQLKIPLMSISSLDDSQPAGEIGQAQPIGPNIDTPQRGHNSRPSSLIAPFQSHSRNSSLTGFLGAQTRRDPRSSDLDVSSLFSPSPPPSNQNPRPPPPLPPPDGTDAPRSATPTLNKDLPRPPPPPPPLLKPHLASPTPEEFLLVTGTRPTEPGIGMFVNLDGDATRPPLEFETYPLSIAVEEQANDASMPMGDDKEDGYVFASLAKMVVDSKQYGIEVQRWGTETAPSKFWLRVDDECIKGPYGVRAVMGSEVTQFNDVIDKLCRTKFLPDSRPDDSNDSQDNNNQELDKELPPDWEARRDGEEREFARRLAGATAKMVVWADCHIWWAIRNPAILQLDAALESVAATDIQAILGILESIRGRDALTELDFMTFNYIRQQAGLLLLKNLLQQTGPDSPFGPPEMIAFEEALVESELDPRVVLSLIPSLRTEIMTGPKGIWIFGGVKATVERYLHETPPSTTPILNPTVLTFLKRFLSSWRRKKGFGSVDDAHMFYTVDAALLIVVLELDKASPPGPAKSAGSVRQELYEIVDKGVDCFERAVFLLESYHRLYILSRLYQSRKLSSDVLATWRRIIEGERDDGGEFPDGERRVREYLGKISNQALVQEYGLWLASRNPKLGVQVFADDTGRRATKFDAVQVVALLRENAPDAVKYYLEHLVFGKGQHSYVNDLISHYLDVVLDDIQSSESSREVYCFAAETYRALHPPKPTFHHFLAANAPPDNEPWQSRLRLLQLLGGAHNYDAAAILTRISSIADELLVAESIILAGRQDRHEDALRLLVHRLGDYDTAVSYCLRGGSTIYGAVIPRLRGPAASASPPIGAAARTRLFRALLAQFLAIADPPARQAQTGMLLDRFGTHFDLDDVLAQVPDDWRVGSVAAFIKSALRRIGEEKREVEVVTALRQAENVRVSYDWVVRTEGAGGVVEFADSGVDLSGQ